MSMHDVVPFLQLLPSLRTLDLKCFGFNDDFFADFTYDVGATPPSLTLPHLWSLKFVDLEFDFRDDEGEIRLHGGAVVHMAESLSRPTGENAAFPALETVVLQLKDRSFGPAIELPLEELSGSGVLRYSKQ
ncbi:hypothetical protein MVEN_00601700 [Mycena venus]|uniref:Uncharacterized protein n=1 Tax=Mycena venus TaxID=2733690 RepID=A0A8H6YP25_9AGAR|nr:hypothetical protein MVEN_00601700 [Mycena venus]